MEWDDDMLTAEEIRQEAELFERDLEEITDFDSLKKTAEEQNMLLFAIAEGMRRLEKSYGNTHGKWIEDYYGYFRCSECGFQHDSPEYTTPYCPECGAKMEVEE